MGSPIRLDDELVYQAELEGRLHKRTTPKQIEFWAEIGKQLERVIDPSDLIAISQGLVRLRLEPAASNPVDPDEVIKETAQYRKMRDSAPPITQAPFYYEASRSQSGLLDRVKADGTREIGYFRDGEFTPFSRG